MKDLSIARPLVGDEELARVAEVLESGWLTQGPRVEAFERGFAARVGAPHACAVSSGTAALHLGLLAAGVRPGDVVIAPSHSFIATAGAVRACGAEPFFVDVELATYNMDPAALEAALETDFEGREGELWVRDLERLARGDSPLSRIDGPRGRLAAVLVVHQVGLPADLAAIGRLAAERGVPLVEDAACAAGSEVSLDGGATWEPVGRPRGDVACFSFHPRKIITTGEGGMITTRSADIDAELRLLRQHGAGTGASGQRGRYVRTAFNYRMSDVHAAIGLAQLERLDDIVARRRQLAGRYSAGLESLGGVRAPEEPPWARTTWQSYVALLEEPAARGPLIEALRREGIHSGPGIMCAHREPIYEAAWHGAPLPQSERASDAGLVLPLYPAMDDADVDRVLAALARNL